MKRNRAIEFYRFFAAVLILGYHCQWVAFPDMGAPFSGYYMFVELFFMLSGFLLMDGVRRETRGGPCQDPAGSTMRYIKNRLKKIYPHHLLSWILVALISCFLLKRITPAQAIQYGWPELLLVNLFGFVRSDYVNIVCWFLSGLIFSSLAIRYLLLRDENAFVKVVAPLLIVICYGTIIDRAECLAATIVFTRYSPHLGFMRSIADMTAGVLAYRVYEWMSDLEHPLEPVISTVLEVAVLVISCLWMTGNQGKCDILMIPLFFIFLISVFRKRSVLSRVLDNRVSAWLGEISFAYFLNNLVVIYLCQFFFPNAGIWQMACICIPACLVLSIATRWISSFAAERLAHFEKRKT